MHHYNIPKPKKQPRKGWEKAFKKMHEHQDDEPIIDDVFDDERFEKWISIVK